MKSQLGLDSDKDEIEVTLTDGVLEIKSADLMADKDPTEGLVHKGIAKAHSLEGSH